MSQELKVEFPQDLQDDLTSLIQAFGNLKDLDKHKSIVSRIHLATNEMMSEIPIWLLCYLMQLAMQMKLPQAIKKINKEITLNLEAEKHLQKAIYLKQSIMQEQGWTEKDWDKLNDWQKLID